MKLESKTRFRHLYICKSSLLSTPATTSSESSASSGFSFSSITASFSLPPADISLVEYTAAPFRLVNSFAMQVVSSEKSVLKRIFPAISRTGTITPPSFLSHVSGTNSSSLLRLILVNEAVIMPTYISRSRSVWIRAVFIFAVCAAFGSASNSACVIPIETPAAAHAPHTSSYSVPERSVAPTSNSAIPSNAESVTVSFRRFIEEPST